MLNHTKFLTIDEIVFNLYDQSCKYVSKRINSSLGKERFKETSLVVKDVLRTNFDSSLSTSSFITTSRNLNRSRDQIMRSYHFRSTIVMFMFDPKKYDELAFELAFDIINKIKIRFYDGYVG